MKITRILFYLALAFLAIPWIGLALGAILNLFMDNCRGDEGNGFHGCNLLGISLDHLMGLLGIGGGWGAVGSLVLAPIIGIALLAIMAIEALIKSLLRYRNVLIESNRQLNKSSQDDI